MERRHFAILPIVIALGFILVKHFTSQVYVNPDTGSKSRVGLNTQQEQQLGLQAYQQVLQKEGTNRVTSGPEAEAVNNVARRLIAAVGERGKEKFNWQVSVIRSKEVNAFCLPGGEIVVYTGILPIAKTEAGLATVLGHEMAHATSHHSAARMYKEQIAQIFGQGVQGSIGNMDPQQQQTIMGLLGAGAKYGYSLPYSRGQESEADHIGLLTMARAGFDPKAALDFWQRMDQAVGQGQPPEFASDHPSNGQRIQQLQGWLPEAEKEYEQSKARGGQAPARNAGL